MMPGPRPGFLGLRVVIMARAKDHAAAASRPGIVPGGRRAMRIESSSGGTDASRPVEARVTRFGSVSLEHDPVGGAEASRNVERGRSALNRMGAALSAPGVRLNVVRGVALYHADPQHPDRLVRVLDGDRQSGVLVDGEFRVL